MKKRFLAPILGIIIALSLSQTAFADSVYIVQRGDTLAAIARQFDGVSWQDIAQANDIVNPNIIYVGQVLRIPDGEDGSSSQPVATSTPSGSGSTNEGPSNHVVQAGENLYRVALRYGTTVDILVALNDINDRGVIYIGQVIKLPDGVTEVIPPTPTQVVAAAPTATPVPAQPTPTAVAVATAQPEPTATPAPAEPTATPVPVEPTPTPVPQVATGVNLLNNGSFENGHYNQGGVAELQLPNGWGFEWDEGATGFGNESWDVWIRPETRVLQKPFLPPNEHGLYFFEGGSTVKIFKGYGAISVRLYQDVELAPGNYQLTIRAFSDMVKSYSGGKQFSDDGAAAEALVFAGGNSTGWNFMPIGQRGELRLNFTVDSTQSVRVGASLRGRFALENNGFFIDHWELVRVN
ncbi:MAG: LysM peptidoglycan-binding domain-containing protein [Chloroflexota bacterium]